MINDTFQCEDILVMGYPAQEYFAALIGKERPRKQAARWPWQKADAPCGRAD